MSTSASRGHARREPEPPAASSQDPEEQQIENLERQVLTLQAETEEVRRAAEQEMERLVRDVRILRLAPSEVETPPAPPEPPQAPSPTAPVVAPPAPPGAPAEAPLPPSPPWRFWFEAGTPDDGRTPEALVADVRAAVIDALEVPGGTLPGLGGDEFITVAVDFVPGGLFAAHARPEHTLVVRARVKDVEARGRGAITPEELRQRVLVVEY